jgi:hypothetical protein
MLVIVSGLLMITASATKWFGDNEVAEAASAANFNPAKLAGYWEQITPNGPTVNMDLASDGTARYSLRNTDLLDIEARWRVDNRRLILHIERVNEGSTFAVGDDVTLGPVLRVDSRSLTLGTDDKPIVFRRKRS